MNMLQQNIRERIADRVLNTAQMIDKEMLQQIKSLELFQSVIRDLLHLMQKITTDIMETESI